MKKKFGKMTETDQASIPLTLDTKSSTFENSYVMEPGANEKFMSKDVAVLAKTILTQHLSTYTYEASTAGEMSKALSRLILETVKEMNYPRYKFVCNVIIGQICGQGLMYCSRSLWNIKTDNHATAEFSKGNFFCIATLHATYYE